MLMDHVVEPGESPVKGKRSGLHGRGELQLNFFKAASGF